MSRDRWSPHRQSACVRLCRRMVRGHMDLHARELRDHLTTAPGCCRDRVAHYAYERAVYPQLYVAVVCIVVAMLCLIGLGLVLRHSLEPDGARQQLMAAGFGAAGLFGALWLFLTIGLLQAVVNVSQGASSETLQTLTDASALIESPANWFQRAFLLLAGLWYLFGEPPCPRARIVPAGLGVSRVRARGPLLAGPVESSRARWRNTCTGRCRRTAHPPQWRDRCSSLGRMAGGAPPAGSRLRHNRLACN